MNAEQREDYMKQRAYNDAQGAQLLAMVVEGIDLPALQMGEWVVQRQLLDKLSPAYEESVNAALLRLIGKPVKLTRQAA